MRTLAGILPPSEGRVEVRGSVSTLLALGVGFNKRPHRQGERHAGRSRRRPERAPRSPRSTTPSPSSPRSATSSTCRCERTRRACTADSPSRSRSTWTPTSCSSTKRSPSATRASSASLSTGCASFAPSRNDLHRQPRPQRSAQALHRDHLVARGKIAMRDDPDSVIDEYKRFLNIGESTFALEDV